MQRRHNMQSKSHVPHPKLINGATNDYTAESEFITMTNQSHFKHITSLKRNYKLHQRALTLSYDEETTLLTNNLLRKIFFTRHPTSHNYNPQTYSE